MSILMFIHFLAQLITGLHFEAPAIPEPTAMVVPAPVQHHQQVATPAPAVTPAPTPVPVVEQPQLPEEIIGRQITGPNGENCVVIDAAGNMTCTAPETECLNGEEYQDEFGCVATQLPEESEGREY
jgi:hypothetical protein